MLEDFDQAPIDEGLRETLRFLRKVTLSPDEVTAADAAPALAAGVSVRALREALEVAYCFNLIDRLADAFGFAVPPPEEFAAAGHMLLKRGYKLGGGRISDG